jgi:protein-S-isoprenylcysteine O-methyltransferase Ste14
LTSGDLMRRLWRGVVVLIGSAGVRLDRSPVQVVVTTILVVSTVAFQGMAIERGHALACCVAAGLFYYVGNTVLCLRPVSERLRARFGEDRCVRAHEVFLGVAFSNQALAVSGFAEATAGTFELPLMLLGAVCAVLTVVGVVTKYWATFLTGLDVYYYRDLFIRRPVGELVTTGPYRWLDNPMYGLGNVHSYVPALIAGSGPGLAVAFVFHAAIYAFLVFVEKPFVDDVIAAQAAA